MLSHPHNHWRLPTHTSAFTSQMTWGMAPMWPHIWHSTVTHRKSPWLFLGMSPTNPTIVPWAPSMELSLVISSWGLPLETSLSSLPIASAQPLSWLFSQWRQGSRSMVLAPSFLLAQICWTHVSTPSTWSILTPATTKSQTNNFFRTSNLYNLLVHNTQYHNHKNALSLCTTQSVKLYKSSPV